MIYDAGPFAPWPLGRGFADWSPRYSFWRYALRYFHAAPGREFTPGNLSRLPLVPNNASDGSSPREPVRRAGLRDTPSPLQVIHERAIGAWERAVRIEAPRAWP